MKIIIVLFLFPFIICANPVELTSVDRQIINYTYNEEYDKAEIISQQQIKLLPNSPKYYYYSINTRLMEYYKKMSELDVEKRDEGRKRLNKELLKYCEDVIDKFNVSKLSIEDKFYYGTIHGYLARVYGMDGSWWSAFRSGKRAKNTMEEIIKVDPQFYDAYLVLGMLNYYADRMRGITSVIAGVLGFSGSRETGLYQVKLAYEKGKLTFGQSALTLIEIYSNLEDNKYEALIYFEDFLKQFPANKRMLNAYCQVLIGMWEVKKVESIITGDTNKLIDDNTKARFYDLIGNPSLAVQYAESALENERILWRGAANYLKYLIVSNSWLNNDNEKIQKFEKDLSDNYKEIFKMLKTYPQESKWLNRLSLLAVSGAGNSIIENYIKDKPKFSKVIFEDRFNLLLGRYYFKNNNYKKAEQYLLKSTNSESESEKYLALRYMIDLYMMQDVAKSDVASLISALKKYDSERLKFRMKDLEKKYNI